MTALSPIVRSLIENSPQTRPTSIGMQFKRPRKIGIGKNRCCGAQALQLVKCLLAPVIPNDCSLLPAYIFTRHQLMQEVGLPVHYLGDDTGDNIPQTLENFWTSVTVVGVGQFLMASTFPSSVAIPQVETMCPRYVICLWNSSHLEGLSFSPACSSFWNMASSLTRCQARSFKKITILSK